MTTSKPPFPDVKQPWHSLPPAQILEQLQGDRHQGLSKTQVADRQAHYGLNEIQEATGRSKWEIFLDQFKNIMLLMLIVVALVSGVMDFIELSAHGDGGGVPFKDTIAILSIVILNGVLGYLQETKAEEALASLKQMSSPQVRVIRDGQPQEIAAKALVPGDMMLVEAGTQLSADGILLDGANLQIRESALTGEAQAVNKSVSPEGLPPDTPLGDRQNMVFTGTEVLQGRGTVIVTGTGMATELGKIAQMLQSVKNEPTPLQQRMGQLGNILVLGSLVLVALVIGLGLLQGATGEKIKELVQVSLSMAVAVVPEGLPAVITVTLAIGTQRMVRRHALIRKLPAVETLGSVDTICSDKTGTLTQNKMVVQLVETLGDRYQVTGEGYDPVGNFLKDNQPQTPENDPTLQGLLWACGLCNDAVLTYGDRPEKAQKDGTAPKNKLLAQAQQVQHQGEWQILGDPTEGALLSLAGKGGYEQETLNQQWQRVGEFPFSSERKRMAVICAVPPNPIAPGLSLNGQPPAYLLFSKGSPELILERCGHHLQGNHLQPLTAGDRQRILEGNNQMASHGLRVLGLALKPLAQIPGADEGNTTETEMVWLGLVGMMDAPRSEVKIAVEKCRAAGIRPVMITGDHQLTARAIAHQLGIAEANAPVMTGIELEKTDQRELETIVQTVGIYARVAPEHKLRIVQALQTQGKFVAMTGDGVNDAPALKQADIGIAMGITGTDVSKEASDMVLLDDNFASIVAATEEGRVVYGNIRRFIKYILGSNIGEVITIAAAPLLGLGVPLTPLQILWMNLVTDGIPALALAVEPAAPDVMERRPFSPKESIFARGLGSYIVRFGLIFALVSIGLMVWAYQTQGEVNPDSWKTMLFTTLCIAQMGHAIAVRSETKLTVEMNPGGNLYLWLAVVVTIALQLMLVYVPPLRSFFETTVLTGQQLMICLAVSCTMFIWVELEKLFVRWFFKRRSL